MLLEALAKGDLRFVERSLSALTGWGEATVAALIEDRGWLGLRSIFRAAALDLRYLRAIYIALEALREAGGSVDPQDRQRHAKRCLMRFLTDAEHLPPEDQLEMLLMLHEIDTRNAAPQSAAEQTAD
jgi:uncharacterized protein (DUF2336 family)